LKPRGRPTVEKQAETQVPYQSQGYMESRHLYPGHRMTSSQVSAMLFPESGGPRF